MSKDVYIKYIPSIKTVVYLTGQKPKKPKHIGYIFINFISDVKI